MKKICFITTIPLTIKCFILDLAIFLHDHGKYDISFICNNDDNFARLIPEYIHYYPVKMTRGISADGFCAIQKIRKICKVQKFDMVQYSTPNASFYSAIAAILAKVPVRLYCQWGIAYVGFSGVKRNIFKIIEKLVCDLSTWIEPDSISNLNFSISEGLYSTKKSSVVWNGSASGVNLEKFDIKRKDEYRNSTREKWCISKSAFVFGFIGRITGDKGINELLEAVRVIVQHDPTIYLMLVGNPEKAESVNADLYEWAQNSPNVIFTGFTNFVERYIAAMDCFVLPSYREGFGLSVVEAEAMGVPVIVSDIPGPIDAMIDGVTGIIVKKMDVFSLRKAMEFLQENVELRYQFGKNGCTFASMRFEQQQLFEYIEADRRRLLS